MSNDLEAEIRDALHSRAMSVTADDPRPDEPRPARKRATIAILAAAAAVVVLALGIAVVAWPNSGDKSTPAAANGGVIGIDWRLVKGIVGTTSFTAASDEPQLALYPDGDYGGSDGVNSVSGTYRRTPTGFAVSSGLSTLVGYAGHDRNVLATMTAFDILTQGNEVDAHVNTDGELVLSRPGLMLWFRNNGPATRAEDPPASR